MKHLLKLGGLTPEEILHILDVADEYKRLHKDGVDPKDLQGKAVALVFAKNSTRTRWPYKSPSKPSSHGSTVTSMPLFTVGRVPTLVTAG